MYSQTEKNKALAMLAAGNSVSAVAFATQISKPTLYNWQRDALKNNREVGQEHIPAHEQMILEKNEYFRTRIAQVQELMAFDQQQALLILQEISNLINLFYEEYPNQCTLNFAIKVAKLANNETQVLQLLKKLQVEYKPESEILAKDIKKREIREAKKNEDIRALEELLAVAKANNEPEIKARILRALLELNSENLEYKIDLAKALVKMYNNQTEKRDWKVARADARLNEAKQLLLVVQNAEPENFQALRFLRIIAILQRKPKNELKYAQLMLGINPDDFEAKQSLGTAGRNYNNRFRNYANYDDKAKAYDSNFTLSDFPKIKTIKIEPNQKIAGSLIHLARVLISTLSGEWNPQLVTAILHQMLENESLSDDERGKIRGMIDKANSKKVKTIFILRKEAQNLSNGFHK